MIGKVAPKSNVERQREFRARNPGYSNRYKLKHDRAASLRKWREIYAAAEKAEAAKAQATPQPPLLAEAPTPLLIPGINTIPTQSIPATLPPPQCAMIADDPYLC